MISLFYKIVDLSLFCESNLVQLFVVDTFLERRTFFFFIFTLLLLLFHHVEYDIKFPPFSQV